MKIVIAILAVCALAFAQMWPTPGPGRAGATATATTARAFNGTLAKLQSTSTYYLAGASAFTVSLWVKSADLTTSNKYLLQSSRTSGQWAMIYGYANDGSGHNQIEFFCVSCTGTSPRTGSKITILDTNWHHVAYRYNGTEWAYFLDGAKTVISASITFALPSTSTSPAVNIGSDGSGSYFKGSIARALISSAALTDGQITALSNTTCSTSGISGTVGYWLLLGASSPEPESSPSGGSNSLTVTQATQDAVGPVCSSQ